MSPAANTLGDATSPYLRQHADNPVHWQQWSPQALAEAADRDVPVLLSVGYAACHWCHVMAHESFADDEVAAAMNADFVCVKVDREERPDIDAVYMNATVALTGHGGWPMTCFLTPAGRRFSAAPTTRKLRSWNCFRPSPTPGEPDATRWNRYRITSPPSCATWRLACRAVARRSSRRCAIMPCLWCSRTRTPMTVGSAARRSSRRRRFWRRCCGTTSGPGPRRRWRRWSAPVPRWPAAESTTSWPVDLPATASTTLGWYRISRRCCTTTRCCCASTPTGRGAPGIRWPAGSPARLPRSC